MVNNVELRKMGLVELIELKNKKEQNLWTLGFRLASRELFDTIVEIEREIELRTQQIKTMFDSKSDLSLVEIDMETLVPEYHELLEFVELQEYIRY